jgi:3',5'-cyclic AMP phosphodiesterase CpdA
MSTHLDGSSFAAFTYRAARTNEIIGNDLRSFWSEEMGIMALLLHLSDLHLVSGSGDILGDDKAKILQNDQIPSRQKRMRDSLSELSKALQEAGQHLDAIIITGDVTTRASPEGFRILPEVLAGLGKELPPANRILVVPGNHDVPQGAPAGSPERYEHFLEVRDKYGYRTAHLEGVDIDADGIRLKGAGPPPVIKALDDSYVLVGLNSANNCWVPDGRYADLAAQAQAVRSSTTEPAVRELLRLIDAGGYADLPRIDHAQLVAATALLRSEEQVGIEPPLRIVALHHQITPVSASEEVKSFESITNLGAFREWLAGSSVAVVLHGHKHKGATLVESFTPTQAEGQKPHVLLVLSAPSIEQHGNETDFGRLLDIPRVSLGVGGIKIADVPARDAGVGYKLSDIRHRYLALDQEAETGLIAGRTSKDVYRRLLAQREHLKRLPSPLVCRFDDGQSARNVPEAYPDIPEGSDPQEWFDTTVEWWQRRPRGQAAKFNHGERLFRTDGNEKDRFDHIVAEFKKKSTTSRAIALLVDGRRDLDHSPRDYPAFISVQFVADGGMLNIVAYYRKQEMPHWWPINVGELARLQSDMIGRLRAESVPYEPGSITTITAMPVDGTGVPGVAVPWIDRAADSDELLLPLVLPLINTSSAASRLGARELWRGVTSDWVPGAEEPTDGDPIPVLGLRRLAAVMRQAAAVEGDDRDGIKTVVKELKHLADANEFYLKVRAQKSGATAKSGRQEWTETVREASLAIEASILELLPEDANS